jgi:hypothetical protein
MPSDMISNYWTILIGNFRMLDDGNPRYICKTCNSQLFDMFEHKENLYCVNGYRFTKSYNEKQNTWNITKIIQTSKVKHIIVQETMRETINRLLKSVFDMLEEPGGFRYNILTLEGAMFACPDDYIFESKYGDIPKRVVKNWLYQVERVIRDRMMELRMEIRFTSLMRTPPVKVS